MEPDMRAGPVPGMAHRRHLEPLYNAIVAGTYMHTYNSSDSGTALYKYTYNTVHALCISLLYIIISWVHNIYSIMIYVMARIGIHNMIKPLRKMITSVNKYLRSSVIYYAAPTAVGSMECEARGKKCGPVVL